MLILNLKNRLKYLVFFVIHLYCCNFKALFPEKSNFPKLDIGDNHPLEAECFGGCSHSCSVCASEPLRRQLHAHFQCGPCKNLPCGMWDVLCFPLGCLELECWESSMTRDDSVPQQGFRCLVAELPCSAR